MKKTKEIGSVTIKVLKMVAEEITVLAVPESPEEFFKDRGGLSVWNGFTTDILKKAKKIEPASPFDVMSFELLRDARDDLIEEALPEEHIFSETDVCAIVAALITNQPKGKKGDLLSNGNWNLFYTKSFVVGVRWYAVSGHWGARAWDRDDSVWRGGPRVFSPAI